MNDLMRCDVCGAGGTLCTVGGYVKAFGKKGLVPDEVNTICEQCYTIYTDFECYSSGGLKSLRALVTRARNNSKDS